MSTYPSRCERAFVGNTIGLANGIYDQAIDLRFCDYPKRSPTRSERVLQQHSCLKQSLMVQTADMTEVVMSKAYAAGASFKGTNFSNAVLDRVNFEKAILQGAFFKNTVLSVSDSTFNEAQLDGAVLRTPL